MNILPLSDLHLEFYKDGGDAFFKQLDLSGVDVLVLAGDIVCFGERYGRDAERLLERFCGDHWTVFVPGNHEYYFSNPKDVHARIRQLEKRLHNFVSFHEPGQASVLGQKFVGATLWFPDGKTASKHKDDFNDFNLIDHFEPWVYQTNERHMRMLNDCLSNDAVVVTHHLPHRRSIHQQYAYSALNAFFLSDCSSIIAAKKPQLWIHGHTHNGFDYKIAKYTRVVCNPKGYPNEATSGPFNLRKIITLARSSGSEG